MRNGSARKRIQRTRDGGERGVGDAGGAEVGDEDFRERATAADDDVFQLMLGSLYQLAILSWRNGSP